MSSLQACFTYTLQLSQIANGSFDHVRFIESHNNYFDIYGSSKLIHASILAVKGIYKQSDVSQSIDRDTCMVGFPPVINF